MASINVTQADVDTLLVVTHILRDNNFIFTAGYMQALSDDMQDALSAVRVPGPDGQPDYVGPLYEVRP